MDHQTQVALIERIQAHQRAGRGTDTAPASYRLPTATYTSADRLAAERRLLATAPAVAGLSGLVPRPGCYATVMVGDVSVIVTRTGDGEVAAMLNVCRHRGAEITAGCGHAARLSCPYHGWSYDLDGTSVARRRGEYFDDVPSEDLVRLPVREQHGLIWVSADPRGTIGDEPLHGAQCEIAPLDLSGYRLFDTTTYTRPINWKLAVDTFCEAYHVGMLHRQSLAPLIHSDFALFDPFGPHGRLVATRKSIDELPRDDPGSWSLLPHATILWFLTPNTVLIHQQDHIELYQTRPGSSPDEAQLHVSLYVPPDSGKSENYWRRNFELLVSVTDTEDFTTAAGIQRGYRANAQECVTFGRNEPALQHYHRSLEALLGAV